MKSDLHTHADVEFLILIKRSYCIEIFGNAQRLQKFHKITYDSESFNFRLKLNNYCIIA